MSKTFAIIGDSYSSYEGYVPEGYFSWYTPHGNECENDMPSVDMTWWKLLASEKNLELVMNCSFSGSAISYSGYPDFPVSLKTSSFVERMKVDLGEKRGKVKAPDYLFVFGGTNDFWAGAPLGKVKYSDFTESDMKFFAPAFCYLLEYLKEWNPTTKIYNLLNDEITSPIRQIMEEACSHYDIELIKLTDVAKENGHPNKYGMRAIADQIEAVMKKSE